MFGISWFSSRSKRTASRRRTTGVRRGRFRPCLEGLEERSLLAARVLDPTFGSGGVLTDTFPGARTLDQFRLPDLVVQPDGRIVVGVTANFPNLNPFLNDEAQFGLIRYTPAGQRDPTFGSGGRVTGSFAPGPESLGALVRQPDGK